METALKDGDLAPVINGWRLTFHMFDYNLDHLGPGTIDDPMGKMGPICVCLRTLTVT